MNKDNLIGRSVLVSGKVQGVFYRASTVDEANKRGLLGWVKNLPSGEVILEVFGSEEEVNALIAWCQQGPPLAKVSEVKTTEIPYRPESRFRVAY